MNRAPGSAVPDRLTDIRSILPGVCSRILVRRTVERPVSQGTEARATIVPLIHHQAVRASRARCASLHESGGCCAPSAAGSPGPFRCVSGGAQSLPSARQPLTSGRPPRESPGVGVTAIGVWVIPSRAGVRGRCSRAGRPSNQRLQPTAVGRCGIMRAPTAAAEPRSLGRQRNAWAIPTTDSVMLSLGSTAAICVSVYRDSFA